MSRARLRVLAVGMAAVLLQSGCVGGEDRRSNARDGGSIVVGASSVPRTLDPALAHDIRSLQLLRLVHTPLLTYPHASGEEALEPVPGLSRRLPRVSQDGLAYTLSLREGLHYSNGVPVRAGDFEHAIERLRALQSPLAPLYSNIAAIDADARKGTIKIRLTQRDSAFAQVLALPSSAPLSRRRSIGNANRRLPAGAGPYAIRDFRPGTRVVLKRTRRGRRAAGHVDRIAVVRRESAEAQARAVLAGALDVMQEPVPLRLLPELRSVYSDRYAEWPTAAAVVLVPDTKTAPLYDVAVRQAIAQALDPQILLRLYRGGLEPSCNLLPETVFGHRPIDPCPYGARDEPADLEAARDEIEETGSVNTTLSLSAADVPPAVVRYAVRALRKTGLSARAGARRGARLRIERLAPLVPHPSEYLNRFDTISDFELRRELSAAAAEASEDESAELWAAADERLVEEAYAIPLGSERTPVFLSARMDAENCEQVHPLFGLDLANLCLR